MLPVSGGSPQRTNITGEGSSSSSWIAVSAERSAPRGYSLEEGLRIEVPGTQLDRMIND